MSLLWAVPPAAFLTGALVVTALLHSVDETARELVSHLGALAEVRHAVGIVQTETTRARTSLEELQRR